MKMYTCEFYISKRTTSEPSLKVILLIPEVISAVENHPVCILLGLNLCIERPLPFMCTFMFIDCKM